MDLTFRVSARIAKPVDRVFEAVVNPSELQRYFTTGSASGRLQTGATVTWAFGDFPGQFPVEVIEVVPNSRIVLRWPSDEPGEPGAAPRTTLVTMTFEPISDGRTLVTICEEGWSSTPGGLKASYGNCQGWTQMLCSLKGYLEYGINLRTGMYA